MVTVAGEWINDNGTSSVALGFFSLIIGGLVTVLVQVVKSKYAAREAAEKADEAKHVAEQAKANTTNISNGFAGGVDKRLDYIVSTLSRVDESITKHLEWHLEKETRK